MPNYYSDRTLLVEVRQERQHSNRNRAQKCKRTQNDNAPCDNSSIFSFHFSSVCLHLCRPGELERFVMKIPSTQDMSRLIESIPFWHVFPNWQFLHFQPLCMDCWILVRWHWRWTIAMTHSATFVYVSLFYHPFVWQIGKVIVCEKSLRLKVINWFDNRILALVFIVWIRARIAVIISHEVIIVVICRWCYWYFIYIFCTRFGRSYRFVFLILVTGICIGTSTPIISGHQRVHSIDSMNNRCAMKNILLIEMRLNQ